MKAIPEKEVSGLQYISGHVFHQFYKNFCNKKNWQCDDTQAFLSISNAGKQDYDESQRLICAKNRGGPWKFLKFVRLSLQKDKMNSRRTVRSIIVNSKHFFMQFIFVILLHQYL